MKRLEDLKNELAQLRVSKVTGGAASKLAKIKVVRKSIARVLTVYNQNQKARVSVGLSAGGLLCFSVEILFCHPPPFIYIFINMQYFVEYHHNPLQFGFLVDDVICVHSRLSFIHDNILVGYSCASTPGASSSRLTCVQRRPVLSAVHCPRRMHPGRHSGKERRRCISPNADMPCDVRHVAVQSLKT